MFERSLVASQVKHASAEERWTALVSITLQVGLAAGVIAVPLLHPERLALRIEAPKVVMPVLKLHEPKVERVAAASAANSSAAMPSQTVALTAPRRIPIGIGKGDPEPVIFGTVDMRAGLPDAFAKVDTGAVRVVPEVRRTEPVRISAGVSAGMLVMPIRPVYPAIAKAAGLQGAVVVEAVISKSGQIESLRVVSGPEMLRRAAVEAIQMARYEPFRLNGEPTEVQTTITVDFRMRS
jgi:periplasmic protein TonB